MIKTFLEHLDVLAILEYWLLGAFLLALFISFRSFSPLLYIAYMKQLFDEPDDRSAHQTKVPTLGGIGVYLSLILTLSLAGAVLNSRILLMTAGAITLLFFLGLKDDLVVLDPVKKFIGQILASFLLVAITDIRIVGFANILSVEVLPYWASILFTVFVFVLIINALNLIDGIDGLAGTVACVASAIFGVLFYLTQNVNAATIAFALTGALLPFLRLNFSRQKKIFMGDTGSLVIGFLLAFFVTSFNSDAYYNPASAFKQSAPILSIAILFFPLMDTLRIVLVRVFIHKTSPFQADKNHIHHRMLELGYTHIQTTGIIVALNVLLIVLAFNLTALNIHWQLVWVLLSGLLLYFLPFALNRKSRFQGQLRLWRLKLRMFLNSF